MVSTTAVPGRGPIKVLVVVTYLAMITMNFLANALPLNGRGTGEVSQDRVPGRVPAWAWLG